MTKKNILFTFIVLFAWCTLHVFSAQAVIVGIKAFRSAIRLSNVLKKNASKPKKIPTKHNVPIVILYDRHDEKVTSTTKEHIQEMETLLTRLASRGKRVHFLCELAECHKRIMEKQKNEFKISRTIDVPLYHAVRNNMCEKKVITYISCDPRTEEDFFIRDIFLETQQFANVIQRGHKFPKAFYNLTFPWYLDMIKKRTDTLRADIKELPIEDPIKVHLTIQCTNSHTKAYLRFNNIKQQFSLADNSHILIALLENNKKQKLYEELFFALIEEQSNIVDVTLCKNVLKSCTSADIIIVHMGLYHAHQLATTLEKIGMTCIKNETNGLRVQSLSSIKLPLIIPKKFIHHITDIFEFDTNTNNESTNKQQQKKSSFEILWPWIVGGTAVVIGSIIVAKYFLNEREHDEFGN